MRNPGQHEQHRKDRSIAVLDVSGLQWASRQNAVAARLGRRPGVLQIEVNPVFQTATVVFDPARTSLAELRDWVVECGYHCCRQSVPSHICDAMEEPDPPGGGGAAVLAEPRQDAHAAPGGGAAVAGGRRRGARWARRTGDGTAGRWWARGGPGGPGAP